MSFPTPSANKHLSANLEIFPKNETKKRSIDLIKEYLSSQPEQIKKIENVSKTIFEAINTFIEITQNYSTQLEILALKIIPNYTTEGQLAQAVQGILLFYSEGLNNLISEIKNENIQIKEDELKNLLKQFNRHKTKYYDKIKETNTSSERFRKEMLAYEEYLVNKEYNEHMKNGDPKNKDDEISSKCEDKIKENNTKKNNKYEKERKNSNNTYENKYNEIYNNNNTYEYYDPIEDIELNNFDNENDLIESHKFFLSNR